jgi:histidine triad (HIT) family protein
MSEAASGCFVCRKHSGEEPIAGGAVYRDELVYASHIALSPRDGRAYLGILFVEPLRHVPGFGDLNAPEAERVGLVASRLARALQATRKAERCYLHVLGHHVPHLHLWIVPRYAGTPPELFGLRVLEWKDAPRGGASEVEAVCDRIRAYLRTD